VSGTKPLRRFDTSLGLCESVGVFASGENLAMGAEGMASSEDPQTAMTSGDKSDSPPTVTVMIPTLNEAGNLPFVLNTIPEWVDEILIVDGRSQDDTLRIATDLRPDVRVLRVARLGKGAAMKAGFDAATGDFIIALDADGSMDGAMIGAFRDAFVAGAEYVKGTRFGPGGGSADITRFRRVGDWGICLLTRLLFGAKYTDATYGYVGIRADAVKKIGIDSDGFEVETLIGIRAQRAGLRIAEVSCFESTRIIGKSNLHAVRDGIRILKVILRERLRRRTDVTD